MPNSTYRRQVQTLGMLCVLSAIATASAILWRPNSAAIFFGCGLICCVGTIAAMAAAYFKRKFEGEAKELLQHVPSDV